VDPTKKANHTQNGCFGGTLSATLRKKIDAIIVEHNLSYDNANTRMVETFIDCGSVVARSWQMSKAKTTIRQMWFAAVRHIEKRYRELGYTPEQIHDAYCAAKEFTDPK